MHENSLIHIVQGPSDYASTDPAWSAFREASFGHGILEVTSASNATWAWQRNQDPSYAVTADALRRHYLSEALENGEHK